MKNIEEFYPLSPMQQGILFHTLYAPNSGVYVEQLSCDIQGNLNISLFQQAWQQLVERHPILRTSFIWEGIKEPVQVVHKQVQLPWQQQDLSNLEFLQQQEHIETCLVVERERGFEISQAPLICLTLLQLAEKHYKFIWSHHHLLLDGWSSSLVLQELFACYQTLSQGKDIQLQKPRPYRDYIAWLQKQDLSKPETFWEQYLKGFTTITSLGISQNFNNQVSKNKNYDTQILRLTNTETVALQSLARQQQLTLNTIVQGAWAILLSRYSGENDILFGGVVSGRPTTLTSVESMVGVFINTLPVRVSVNPQEFLLPWLKQLQIQQNEVRQYEYTPLIEIQKWSEIPAGQPLFESIFNFHNYPINSSLQQPIDNLKIFNINSFIHPHYPLNISVQVDSELSLEIFYDRLRFDDGKIAQILGHLQTSLLGMVANPQQRIGELPFLTATERYQLLEEWNNTQVDYPQDQCIHQLFEAQVEKNPDAVAVVFENQQLTYWELNAKADQLAHYLQKLGVKPEVLVGICVERSLEMIIALLATLKAGGAYIPLDPTYPQERLAFMLEDSQISVLLTQQHLLKTLPRNYAQVICLDSDWESIAAHQQSSVNSKVNPSNLSYTIYTSGSTGKPKGVQITHHSVVNFLTAIQQKLQLTNTGNLLSVTTLSFDIAVLEIFLPLTTGAKLILVSREVAIDGVQLLQQLNNSATTIMQATPATWRMLLDAGWEGNTQLKILCGGEALPQNLASQLCQKAASVWNLYGPTETTIWSTIHQVDEHEAFVPIGRPIANTQIYILDKHLQPVPVGVSGELYIGGVGLARGYFNQPELTKEKFIPNPFTPARLLYKTGDLARYLPNGEIEYLGRIDYQVKLRGFRIELGEIEAVLEQHTAVRQCVVMMQEDVPGNQRLVAYLVAENAATGELCQYLRQKLPEYMIPSAFVILDSLPLTPNGKVNRRALPAPENNNWELASSFVAPRHPVEEVLAGIWTQVLGVSQVSIHDNFFELGGHSLLATQAISRVRKTFSVDIPLQQLFESPTIAEFAKVIQQATKAKLGLDIVPIKPVGRDRHLPLSFAQQRLWLQWQLQPDSVVYNIPVAVRLLGNLNVIVLEQSLNEIVRRHEVLRTTFSTVDDQVFQVIAPSIILKLPVIDLCQLPQTQQELEVQQLILAEYQRTFDLTQGLLLRCTLLHLGTQEHIVILTIHHIAADGWSMGVFVQELAALYTAFAQGKPSPLPKLSIQYADFAVWQQQWLQGEALETQLAYWKKQLGNNLPTLELSSVSEAVRRHRPRPAVQTFQGARQILLLSETLSTELKNLSAESGVTLFMSLLSAFQVLLYWYTNQEDIVVGTDVANRNQAEIEGLIGFFVNQLVLRTDLSGNPTFLKLLHRVREVTLGAYAHQDLPFDKLVETLNPQRDLSRTLLFQVKFILHNTPMPPLELPGLNLNLMDIDPKTAEFDLLLNITDTEQGLIAVLEYNTDLFNASTMARLLKEFETLLNTIVKQPDSKLKDLTMVLTELQQQEYQKTVAQKLINIKRKSIR